MQNQQPTNIQAPSLSVEKLSNSYPGVPWKEIMADRVKIFKGLKPIPIHNYESYLQLLQEVIKLMPPRTIANYLGWMYVFERLDTFEPRMQEAMNMFKRNIVGKKRKEDPPRWKHCVNLIIGEQKGIERPTEKMFSMVFAKVTEAMYARAYFSSGSSKKKLKLMSDKIINSVKESFEKNDWMSVETKQNAMKKINHMIPYMLYSDEVFDDDKINELYKSVISVDMTDNYATNMENPTITKYTMRLTNYDRNDWRGLSMAPIYNAHYAPEKNYFMILMGWIGGKNYDKKRPDIFNYATLGSTMGHEITHGFDSDGRKYNYKGAEENWWSGDSEKKYNDKIECIVDLYSNYSDGREKAMISKGEDTADIGGVKLAHRTYFHDSGPSNKMVSMKGLEDLTARKLFWLAYSVNWCQKELPSGLTEFMKTDTHSQNKYRILGPVTSNKEFAEDWNCPAGSRHNPEIPCGLW